MWGFFPPTILNIERWPLARGYNSKFSYLESVWARVMLWGCSPYNSVRDYPGYNSKLGYNSSFLCLEYEGVDNVEFLPLYNST